MEYFLVAICVILTFLPPKYDPAIILKERRLMKRLEKEEKARKIENS